MAIIIRPATAADQSTIRQIDRAARLNPLNLDWSNFLVAVEADQIIGIGQVKPHGDGSRELASIAVVPAWQGQGVGRQLIDALLAREPEPVYLICLEKMSGYYQRFGFHIVERPDLPPVLARFHRLGNLLSGLTSVPTSRRQRVIAMKQSQAPII
jgi:amino-acid N-acetyltransferase